MKRLWTTPLMAVLMMTCALVFAASLTLIGCGAASSQATAEHAGQDITECGAPMATEVAKRAASVAFDQAAKGASAEELEQLIVGEIKTVAGDYGPSFVQCLVDRALKRSPVAVLESRMRWRVSMPPVVPIASAGFVPLERDPVHQRPWHTLLAGARGVRS